VDFFLFSVGALLVPPIKEVFRPPSTSVLYVFFKIERHDPAFVSLGQAKNHSADLRKPFF